MRDFAFSDLHLLDGSWADDFLWHKNINKCIEHFVGDFERMINRNRIDYLISTGDLFEDKQCKHHKIEKAYKVLLNYLRGKGTQFLPGNHDPKRGDRETSTLRMANGYLVLTIHTHQGDPWLTSSFNNVLTWTLGIFERMGWKNIDNYGEIFYKKRRSKLEKKAEKYVLKIFKKDPNITIIRGGHVHKLFDKKFIIDDIERHWLCTGDCQKGKIQGWIIDTERCDYEKVDIKLR